MTHLDVAAAQQRELALYQRNSVAALVRDVQFTEQFIVLGEERRVVAQVGNHGLSPEGGR
ncbi:hypothetical protein D3C81_917400 [compost metagenome]